MAEVGTTMAPTPPPRPLRPVDGLALFLFAAFAGGLLGALLTVVCCGAPAAMSERLSPPGLLASAVGGQLGFLGVVVLYLRWQRQPAGAALALRSVSGGRLLAAALGTVGVGVLTEQLAALLPMQHSVMADVAAAVQALSGPRLALVALLAGILPALCEEMLFRGAIQSSLAGWRPVWAVIATAGLFGLAHLDPVQTPVAILLGLYLGGLRAVTGSLYPAAAGHALYNTLGILALRAGSSGSPPSLVAAAVGLAVAAAGFRAAWVRGTPR